MNTSCCVAVPFERADSTNNSAPTAALWAGPSVDAETFADIRRRAILDGCKWDPQVGDVGTLADFPLMLKRGAWNELATLAESMTCELLAAEEEILVHRPELLKHLGFPLRLLRALSASGHRASPAALRVMRFDFHPTSKGWRLSEVNSDVPGGFTEASCFTGLMAEQHPGARPAGHPVSMLVDTLAQRIRTNAVVALLSAPGYMEDHQILAYLARLLSERGCQTHLANPLQVRWRDGIAHLETAWHYGPLDAVLRFFQVEWLVRLTRRCGWEHFFHDGCTPSMHPGQTAISESKRFPLVWDSLRTPMATWRALLPESHDPREAPWRRNDEWLVKAALSNTGDDVWIRELSKDHSWHRVEWTVCLNPSRWVAQRRFASVPVSTPKGFRHVCLGVYTVNGRAAGIYARLALRPLIDYSAVDVATLVVDDE